MNRVDLVEEASKLSEDLDFEMMLGVLSVKAHINYMKDMRKFLIENKLNPSMIADRITALENLIVKSGGEYEKRDPNQTSLKLVNAKGDLM